MQLFDAVICPQVYTIVPKSALHFIDIYLTEKSQEEKSLKAVITITTDICFEI